MCLIVLAWQSHPQFPLIVAANRDEWLARPTARLHRWDTEPAVSDADDPAPRRLGLSMDPSSTGIIAGRDLQGTGTWMGITGSGRFAALTNYRDPHNVNPGAPSRGRLVTEFLSGTARPGEYSQQILAAGTNYNGFNLLVGSSDELAFMSNREAQVRCLEPGIYGVSNGALDEPWPKVVRAKSRLTSALAAMPDETALWDLLSDDAAAPDDELPDTGVGLEWERILSPALIRTERYGTRSSTLLWFSASGRGAIEERLVTRR